MNEQDLRKWVNDEKLTLWQIAEKSGRSRNTIFRYMKIFKIDKTHQVYALKRYEI